MSRFPTNHILVLSAFPPECDVSSDAAAIQSLVMMMSTEGGSPLLQRLRILRSVNPRFHSTDVFVIFPSPLLASKALDILRRKCGCEVLSNHHLVDHAPCGDTSQLMSTFMAVTEELRPGCHRGRRGRATLNEGISCKIVVSSEDVTGSCNRHEPRAYVLTGD